MTSTSGLEPCSDRSLGSDAIGCAKTTGDWYERHRLALQFLHGLERVVFPSSSTERQACESAAVLWQAGLIRAEVHPNLRQVVIWGLTEVGLEFFSRRHGKSGAAGAPPVWHAPRGLQDTALVHPRARAPMSVIA
ncbi:hypothetical protein [Variovorax paradoxus]|uniref:Uncharacterized protein n=1 Tax=Variovorax paradoxus TaxID=34073 RepID=A0A679JL19_VARPD|nr:hypothetical protein VVAX_05942 [Variovorax paradoxus]